MAQTVLTADREHESGCQSLAGATSDRTVEGVKFEKATVRALAAVAAVLIILATGLALSSGGVVRVSAGPAQSASEVLHVDRAVPSNPDAEFSPLITTVRAEELTKWQALVCGIKPSCDTLVLAEPLGSDAPAAQMDTSIEAASAAADALLGEHAAYPEAPGAGATIRGIGGPSAGLSLALHFVNLRSTGDLFAEHEVAATGTIDEAGAVGPVGGVKHKAIGANRAVATVFVVPSDEAQEAAGHGVEVVGVDTLAQAVHWLCENGATSSACD